MKRETKYDLLIGTYFFGVMLGGAFLIADCIHNPKWQLAAVIPLGFIWIGGLYYLIKWMFKRLDQPVLTKAQQDLKRREAHAMRYL